MFNYAEMGVTFTPENGSSTHSFTNWGVFMAPASYDVGKEKTLLVYLPYKEEPLDFSDINKQRYFEESKFTYEFFGKADSGTDAMAKVMSIKTYFNDFRGTVSDDMLNKKSLEHARCTGFDFSIHPINGFFSMTIEVTGIYK